MTPYYSEFRNQILAGHVLEVLRTLPAACVQAVVTSPPYWGLRAYGTAPQVWTAEREPCRAGAHVWENTLPRRERTADDYGDGDNIGNRGAAFDMHGGNVCAKCGAWRGELGLEPTPELFVRHMVTIFREVWRVLRDDGTLWLNLGDTYATHTSKRSGQFGNEIKADAVFTRRRTPAREMGLKEKDLCGIPWRVALALQADGWYLRSDIIWAKRNCMPESVRDRPTKSHEHIFLLTKQPRYYYDVDAIREPQQKCSIARMSRAIGEQHKYTDGAAGQPPQGLSKPRKRQTKHDVATGRIGNFAYDDPLHNRAYHPAGRNRRDVWNIATQSYHGAHFATFPEKLVQPCILAGTSARGACPICGAPYARVTEPSAAYAKVLASMRGKWHPDPARARVDGVNFAFGQRDGPRSTADYRTVGWQPTCACDVEAPVPCLVLDPFFGSGTTGLVAHQLGRDFVGIELQEEYIKLAEARLAATLAQTRLF